MARQKKYVAGMVAGRIVRVAASGADSIDEVQTLSIRLPNGDLPCWQVPRGTPIESITEDFEKELPPYHEAKVDRPWAKVDRPWANAAQT